MLTCDLYCCALAIGLGIGLTIANLFSSFSMAYPQGLDDGHGFYFIKIVHTTCQYNQCNLYFHHTVDKSMY